MKIEYYLLFMADCHVCIGTNRLCAARTGGYSGKPAVNNMDISGDFLTSYRRALAYSEPGYWKLFFRSLP
jgi:hypothetical protein